MRNSEIKFEIPFNYNQFMSDHIQSKSVTIDVILTDRYREQRSPERLNDRNASTPAMEGSTYSLSQSVSQSQIIRTT